LKTIQWHGSGQLTPWQAATCCHVEKETVNRHGFGPRVQNQSTTW